MVNYYAKRVGQAILVLFSAVSLVFVMYRLMPFGPVEIIRVRLIQQMTEAGETPSPQEMARINELVEAYTGLNPESSLHEAYIDYMLDIIVYQDFGHSIHFNEPVFQLLFSRMPWSIFISIFGLAMGTTVSLVLGAAMAQQEGSRFDTGLTIFTIVNSTIPYYITAIVLIIVFGFRLEWFPTAGRFDPNTNPGFNYEFMASVMYHGTLPILSTFIAGFGGALAYRGNCIRELGKDYIRVGRLRGISEGRLTLRYVGRNSLLPIYTSLMMGIAGLFGSGVIIEVLFNYQAVGLATFTALQNRDYPLLMGAFIFFTTLTVLGILIADLTYGIIDPRVKGGGERESF